MPARTNTRCLTSVLFLLAPIWLATPVFAEEQVYHVSGKDSFQIGSRDLRSDVVYDGDQTLTIAHKGKTTRYSAKVSYTRVDQGATEKMLGSFVSVVAPDGAERDEANGDPDFLTILNQPFAVQLDGQTLHDVTRLQQPAPFSFSSPMTRGQLHGTLRHLAEGLIIAGERVVGIGFEAHGPIKGSVPSHPEIALIGTIRMSGIAYYTERSALLQGLDATLTISGNLADRTASDPVTIVYKRSIRAQEPAAAPAGAAKSTRAPKKARPPEVASERDRRAR
ncbi:MAG: hypothetical protein JO359_07605 [Candidatus Eremiobacteraeota bacterium]|nr:hypothetical protein [Candidatus Eremiobacteraeota bacterium]